ncbi:hypothetical protein HY623_01210 [Candidatus Uhrbacteria bacterium]|nr:hypothetical protein [Candidatus Uhrbacteria bacterium]
MNTATPIRLVAAVITLLFIGQSCALQFSESEDTGLFKSVTAGRSWRQKEVLRLRDGTTATLNEVDVTRIVVDARRPQRIFMGTARGGLFASENGGEEWLQLISGQIVSDIAIDPTSRCQLYFSTPAAVMRTTNCADSWEMVFRETRDGVAIRSIALDYSNPSVVYISTTAGDLFVSADGGLTWRTLYREPGRRFTKFIIDPFLPSILYLADEGGYMIRSADRGVTWQDISANLASFPDARSYRAFEILGNPDSYFYASGQGLFLSTNGGAEWLRIPLLTPQGSAPILLAGANIRNDREFFYVTRNTFYHTVDRGEHWFAQSLPSGTIPAALAVDPTNAAVHYLGFRKDRRDLEPFWYYGSETFY